MSRTLKIVVAVLVVVVVAGAGAGYFFVTRIDSLVQAAIESHGSRVLGTAVSLAGVDIDPADGRGTLSGLTVANPQGFPAGEALAIDETSIAIDLASLARDPIVIREVSVRGARFRYQITAQGGNLDRIAAQVRGAEGGGAAGAGGGEASAPEAEGPGRKIMLRRLVIAETEVSVTAPELGDKTIAVSLPTIELTDLGTDGNGLDTPALVARIFAALETRAQAEFEKVPTLQAVLPESIQESVKETLEETGGKLDSLGERLDQLFKK